MPNQNKKKRSPIPQVMKVRSRLQREIKSLCPFCPSADVEHFQIHHIDDTPSNNEYKNLILLCPICHSKITKGDISQEEVRLKKEDLQTGSQKKSPESLIKYDSKEIFQTEFNSFVNEKNSIYHSEIKLHWNCSSLLEEAPLLNEIVNENLSKSVDYGVLSLISDIAKSHLAYDREAKYIYQQEHIHMHIMENEGYNMPIYYHIKFIGILYFNAIENRIDIATLSKRYSHMFSIFAGIIHSMIKNLGSGETDNNKEYPTNYHWLISEIFWIMRNWLEQFNDARYFNPTSSYMQFIPSCISSCLSELYEAMDTNKISCKFLNSKFHLIINSYFNTPLNSQLRESINENIIAMIPQKFIKPIFKYWLNEDFAIQFDDFCEGNFRNVNGWKRDSINHLRTFLIAKNKIYF